MTLEDKVWALCPHLPGRAWELRNVSAVCKELGVSSSLSYERCQRFVR